MKIELKTDNAAFDGDDCDIEIARILHQLATNIEKGNRPNSLYDINGNKVGRVVY